MHCWHANTYPHWRTGINYFFVVAHKAERFEGEEGEIERQHREMKYGKETLGVNDGLERERGRRRSKRGEVRRNEKEGGQQEREMKGQEQDGY